MSTKGKKGTKVPPDWTPAQDRFINACRLTGTSLAWARDTCILIATNERVIKEKNWEWVRTSRASNQKRSLDKLRRNGNDARNDYVVVPLGYDFADVVRVPDGVVLPKFTKQHYLSQFSSPPSSSTTTSIKQSTMVKPATTPPKNVRFNTRTTTPDKAAMDSLSQDLSSTLKLKLVDLPTVNPEDAVYNDVHVVAPGSDNSGGIIAALLSQVEIVKSDGKDSDEWMSAAQLAVPLVGGELNEHMLQQKGTLVRTADEGRIAVDLKSPNVSERLAEDMETVSLLANNDFGNHDNREKTLNATLTSQLERESTGELQHQRKLLILPDEWMN
jgi:hypothetical protein